MTNEKAYIAIGALLEAMSNCVAVGNTEWYEKHKQRIVSIAEAVLPSGSGFGLPRINFDKSNASRIVIETAFHHMNENGFWDGWTDHTVTVKPTFGGFSLTISGRDRNDVKECIAQAYEADLNTRITINKDESISVTFETM